VVDHEYRDHPGYVNRRALCVHKKPPGYLPGVASGPHDWWGSSPSLMRRSLTLLCGYEKCSVTIILDKTIHIDVELEWGLNCFSWQHASLCPQPLSGCEDGELVGGYNVLAEDRIGSGLSFICQPGFHWVPTCNDPKSLTDPICLDWVPGFQPSRILMMLPDTYHVNLDRISRHSVHDRIIRRGLRSLYRRIWPLEDVISFYYDVTCYDRSVHWIDYQSHIRMPSIRRTFTNW
jgi:hypothetical protein